MFNKTLPLLVSALLLAAPLSSQTSVAQKTAGPGLAPLMAKPEKTLIHPSNHSNLMVVKFGHHSGVRVRDGKFTSILATPNLLEQEQLTAIDALLDLADAQRTPYFAQSEQSLTDWRMSGELRSGTQLHDLNLFFAVELPAQDLLGETCDALNAFDVVEIAYPASRVGDPVAPPSPIDFMASMARSVFAPVPSFAPAFAFTTASAPAPDFEGQQGYRTAAPTGIDADWGQTFSGSRGEGTLIADVETGWTDDHEDISHKALGNFIGLTPAPYPWDHGTAVLGELVGEDNADGVKGSVHQADVVMSSHLGSAANIGTAIVHAANAAGVGDVVVLEVQCYSSAPSPHPCEYDAAIFATVQTATANGTHVFAAAGNGANDLDQSAYGGAFDRNVKDSGAVMVGASNGSSLDIAYFSNYGSRLDVHGWGFDVVTTGYGDLYNGGGVTSEYTAAFSGTSSATPIATGAGIMVNGINREAFGSDLTPLNLRALLTATGTPQGSGGQIGPRPNVRAAIDWLGVPQITLAGNNVPGGFVEVTLKGKPGDTYRLGFSNSLLTTPTHSAPYGYRYLGATSRITGGVIPATGLEVLNFPIPNDPNLSGQTVGYVQGLVTFTAGPGTGTFTNYAPVEIL